MANMNLSLYTVNAFIILDSEGNRVLAKYYRPKGHPNGEWKDLVTLKEQRAFEKGLWAKTKKNTSPVPVDVILYDSRLVLTRHSMDVICYFLADPNENELMMAVALNCMIEAFQMLLRNTLEKRGILENLDLILLGLDETIDDGIVVDTDSAAIASRVTRARADSTDLIINEQTILSAYQRVKEGVQARIGLP